MEQVQDPAVPRQQLPDGIADLPPGAELAAQLAGVDLSRLNGHDLIAVAPAVVKMISHYQAQLADLVVQVHHCPPGDAHSAAERVEQPNQWAHVDLATGLRWSASKAVLAVDPDAARRRRRDAQAHRMVQTRAHEDGTASVYAINLPPERVAEMIERVEAIARTAKQQGDRRTIHQLRADIVCDLIAGVGIGAAEPGPITNPGPTGLTDPLTEPDPEPADEATEPAEPANQLVPLPGPRRGVVHVYTWLSTLLGADVPGELEGIGPIDAGTIRKIIAEHPDLQWRLSLYDDLTGCDGTCGTTTSTATGSSDQLVWHGSLHNPRHGRSAPPATGEPDTSQGSGFSATDVAFIHARDRTCRGPQACPVPATRCDTDHTIAKADGGGHTIDNGEPLCEREHLYKHHSGATLQQIQAGVFIWTTQYGHTYTTHPETPDDTTGLPPRCAAQRLERLLPPQPQAP